MKREVTAVRRGRWLTLALAAIALTGCETTAEESARLQRQAKRVTVSETGLTITHESTDVHVLSATIVRNSERAAAVVTVRNGSARAQSDVPIAITVKNARGGTVFQNNGPGLEAALVSLASISPHSTVTWVDDQLTTRGATATVSARVGQAHSVSADLPRLIAAGTKVSDDPANGLVATGTVVNRSSTAQKGLVVFVVARRAGSVVAAGRAIVPELAANASTPFQASLAGDASGAGLEAAAPPTNVK
jgi:hypothetical protein